MKSRFLAFLCAMAPLIPLQAGGGAASLNVVTETHFPESWNEPQVLVMGNSVIYSPAIPVLGKTTPRGTSLNVSSVAVTRQESQLIVERLSFVDTEPTTIPYALLPSAKSKDRSQANGAPIARPVDDTEGKTSPRLMRMNERIIVDGKECRAIGITSVPAGEAKEGKAAAEEKGLRVATADGSQFVVSPGERFGVPATKVRVLDPRLNSVFPVYCPGVLSIRDAKGNEIERYDVIASDDTSVTLKSGIGLAFTIGKRK